MGIEDAAKYIWNTVVHGAPNGAIERLEDKRKDKSKSNARAKSNNRGNESAREMPPRKIVGTADVEDAVVHTAVIRDDTAPDVGEQGYDETVVSREEQFKCRLSNDAESVVVLGLMDDSDNAKCSVKEIIIPDTVEGMPVVAIGCGAFEEYTALKRVTLPSGLEGMYNATFRDCSALKQVIIPKGIKRMEFYDGSYQGSFEGCVSLSLSSQAALRKLGYTGEFEYE